jgi:hypothetical protein
MVFLSSVSVCFKQLRQGEKFVSAALQGGLEIFSGAFSPWIFYIFSGVLL